MSFRAFAVIAIALLFPALVHAALSEKDEKFVKNAAKGGMMEVDLGTLAMHKAANDDVKKFGKQMVDDHGKANEELKKLAQTKGVDLKDSEEASKKEGGEKIEKFGKMDVATFDKSYIDDMVEDHEKDVKEFEEASKGADDADPKAWAAKTLPTLKDHLKMAKETQEKLKKTPR